MKNRKKISVFSVISMTILIMLTIFFIFPFYWIATGAFKIQEVAISIPPEWFPLKPTLENFDKLLIPLTLRWFFNSVVIAFSTTVLVCTTASLAGYALAKKKFPGSGIIFIIFVAAMALPKQVILIPLLKFITELGWIDTYKALVLPAVGWPFGVFLMKQFSEGIPTEMLEAARIDGASEFKTFTDIVFQMVKPGVGALAIFTFINSWNDYFMQLIMLSSTSNLTISLGIAKLQAENSTDFGLIMAGATLAAAPILIVFIALQKYFTKGITLGAVKG